MYFGSSSEDTVTVKNCSTISLDNKFCSSESNIFGAVQKPKDLCTTVMAAIILWPILTTRGGGLPPSPVGSASASMFIEIFGPQTNSNCSKISWRSLLKTWSVLQNDSCSNTHHITYDKGDAESTNNLHIFTLRKRFTRANNFIFWVAFNWSRKPV